MDVRELRNHLNLSTGGVERPEAREPATLEDTTFDQASFGSAIRRLRGERGWTLRDLSDRSKISQSALSRVETGQITLSFDRAHALARALDADFSQFLSQMGPGDTPRGPSPVNAHGWRSVTRRGQGEHVTQPNADYEYLCTDFLYRKMVSGIAVITALSLEQHGPFVTHPGEEFVHVLEGTLVVATEFYAPLTLDVGDSLQFDSTTPHALYSLGGKGARVMFSVTDPRWE
ncbi:transcriptional regulator, HTH_3 family [alpha proteobacterium U9-1i]|nr:transcriptional regulator, HTH_3 family [alpha proteobacterium U9-1i]